MKLYVPKQADKRADSFSPKQKKLLDNHKGDNSHTKEVHKRYLWRAVFIKALKKMPI